MMTKDSLVIFSMIFLVSQCNALFTYGRYTSWSGCSKTCGKGISYRIKLCNFPFACSGSKTVETKSCVQQPCGVLKKSEPQAPETAFDSLDEKSIQKIYPSTVRVKCGLTSCLGAIISNKHVLTSAKCVVATSFAYQVCQLRVIAGIPNALYYDSERVMGESIQVKSAIKTTIHQEFNSKKYVKNNIAIIELKTPLTFSSSYVRPICIGGSVLSSNCVTIDLEKASNTLSVTGMTKISLGECQQQYGFWKVGYKRVIDQIDQDTAVCASKSSRTAVNCQGTSGSGLMCQGSSGNWALHGITSYGDLRCGWTARPGVFVNINNYKRWIEATTGVALLTC